MAPENEANSHEIEDALLLLFFSIVSRILFLILLLRLLSIFFLISTFFIVGDGFLILQAWIKNVPWE